MREAIGGSWLLGIVAVFIFLFLFFISYSINYTRAFNVKNEILNYIEHSEGFTMVGKDVDLETIILTDENKETVQYKAYELIRKTGYDYDNVRASDCTRQNKDDLKNTLFSEGGYGVVKVCQDSANKTQNTYYKVTTFITMKVPVFGIGINIPVSGQTRTIYQDKSGYDCDY